MEEITTCPLCGLKPDQVHKEGSRGIYTIDCPRCKRYSITMEYIMFTDVKAELSQRSHLLSGLSRELHDKDLESFTLMTTNIDEVCGNYLVPADEDVEEKAKKVLVWLKQNSTFFGEFLVVQYEQDMSIAYARNAREFIAILELLDGTGLATIQNKATGSLRMVLSAKGWSSLMKSTRKESVSDNAFVAIWFNDQMQESIDAICAAVKECGYKPVCIRDELFSEKIMDKALSEIRDCRFMIVDLTGVRPSVYFEAGFAHGLGIDTIYVYKEMVTDEKSPRDFYVNHYQCYKYQNKEDLKERLVSAIKARIAS